MKIEKNRHSSARKALRLGTAMSGAALALAVSGTALAQDADDTSRDDIVVTGTLIRGIAPAGTSVVSVSEEDVQATGATTVSDLLTTVPQFGAFNDFNTLSGGGNFVTTNRPNLRNLPGFTTTGTSATLMLVDGHRVVGMGISSSTPDADFIPPGILQRVEIVPDGGSALYGSDAVAGVVNFITKKSFDGVEVDARYGFGKQYHTFDANATIGKAWDDGSVYVSYNYTENSSILGRDRAYNFTPQVIVDGVTIRDLECPAPNLRVAASPGGATTMYRSLTSGPNTGNECDLTDETALFPEQERHSVYAGLNQQLNDWLEVDVKAFYYRKKSLFTLGQYSGSVNLGPSFLAAFGFVTSPFDVNLTGSPFETKSVNFALGPDNTSDQVVTLDSWGITPTLTADLGGSWQARALVGYSESKSVSVNPRLVPGQFLGPLVASGAFNPFDPTNADIPLLTDWETFGQTDQRQFNARITADGDLFQLPGGAVKLAVGAEFIEETYNTRKGDTRPAARLQIPKFDQNRTVKSVFGEIVAPIFKTDGGMSLTVSASGRYDDYSDVGGTFNPKFGATFKPVDWISIRGAWGESFVAPSLADSFVADPTNLNWITGATLNFIAPPAVLAANGFPAVGPGQHIMFLLGSSPGLTPQTATTWSVGADIEPPFLPGFKLSGTYYNITYENLIQLTPFINQNLFFSTFAPTAFILNPTQAQIDDIKSQAGRVTGAECGPQPSCVYGIQDVRKSNLGGFKQDGIDVAVNYFTNTGFGSVDLSVNGTHVLNRKNSPTTGDPFTPEGAFSDLKVRGSLGANIGNLRAEASVNYSKGFDLDSPVGLGGQTKVGDFTTVDMFFKYDFDSEGPMQDLAISVTVRNLLDDYPPIFTGGDIVRNQRGFRNGNTVGRLVQVGVSKKF